MIIGKNRKTKHTKVSISAGADFTPFVPPTRQSSRKKAPIKIISGHDRSALYTVFTVICPTLLEIIITLIPGLHTVPNNKPFGQLAVTVCPAFSPVSIRS